ncbi:response regulator [Desulfatitalea tepidiphila]|uniref:response regulator n=1 Tax=Desulfatitalea tepidiphila TaxID=1185843 RepID=UPI0006B44F29|nr:response regulator [Desulfatitalea tepidiphila]
MKALVVDDSLVVRTIIQNAVKPIGYEVLQACNGKEALDLLATHGPSVDLVLLDWNMPVQDGYETIKQIKANDAYNHLCILMISTESEDDKVDQALSAGANGYLAKPFSEEELAAKIKTTLAAFKSK